MLTLPSLGFDTSNLTSSPKAENLILLHCINETMIFGLPIKFEFEMTHVECKVIHSYYSKLMNRCNLLSVVIIRSKQIYMYGIIYCDIFPLEDASVGVVCLRLKF